MGIQSSSEYRNFLDYPAYTLSDLFVLPLDSLTWWALWSSVLSSALPTISVTSLECEISPLGLQSPYLPRFFWYSSPFFRKAFDGLIVFTRAVEKFTYRINCLKECALKGSMGLSVTRLTKKPPPVSFKTLTWNHLTHQFVEAYCSSTINFTFGLLCFL